MEAFIPNFAVKSNKEMKADELKSYALSNIGDESGNNETFMVKEKPFDEFYMDFSAEFRLSEHTLLVYCSEGSAVLCVDMDEFSVERGSCFFIFPYKALRLLNVSSDFHVVCFVFCRDIFDEMITGLSTAQILYIRCHPEVRLTDTDCSFFGAMTEQLRRVQKDEHLPFGNKIVANILSNFLLIHYGALQISDTPASLYNRSEEIFKRFMTDIEVCCNEIHNVTDYAEKLCITTKHLTGITRAKTGKSPKEMIDEVLLRRAQCELKNSSKSVKEISSECGFPNSAYFSRFFRRMAGVTPLEYRIKLSE
mgnify:FL=1